MWNPFQRKKKRKIQSSALLFDQDGVKIYGWSDLNAIPVRRYLAHILAANEAELGITRKDLLAMTNGIRESYLNNVHTKVGWFSETLQFYLDNYPPEKVIFQMIHPLVRLEGEPEDRLHESFTLEKAQLYEGSPEVRAFFLSYGFDHLANSGLLSEGIARRDFLKTGPAPHERTFSRLIGSATYSDYLSD